MIAAPDKFQARIAKYQLNRAFRREHQHLHMSKVPSFPSGELGASSRCWHILTQCKQHGPELLLSWRASAKMPHLLGRRCLKRGQRRFVSCWCSQAPLLTLCFFQWMWHLCHTLGCLLLQSQSPLSLATLTSAGNIYEGIHFWWHMQILICEHNYLLCMHKTDSLAHSVGIT